MGLRDIESMLPPGFRFYPSDEELISHYLYKKVSDERVSEGTLEVVDLHTREPWELPDGAKLSENEWYFFSFRDRKYSTGSRANRATKSGYWKATGKDRTVCDALTQAAVGMRKTLVFYRGRAPHGIKTGWVMHEFRLEGPHMPPKEDWVLCRVFHKMKGETVRYAENKQDGIVRSPMQPSLQVDHDMSHGYMMQHVPNTPHAAHHQQEATAIQNSLLNLSVWHYGFQDFQEETSCSPPADCGERYRFLLDVKELEDHDMGDPISDVSMSRSQEMGSFHDGEGKMSI